MLEIDPGTRVAVKVFKDSDERWFGTVVLPFSRQYIQVALDKHKPGSSSVYPRTDVEVIDDPVG